MTPVEKLGYSLLAKDLVGGNRSDERIAGTRVGRGSALCEEWWRREIGAEVKDRSEGMTVVGVGAEERGYWTRVLLLRCYQERDKTWFWLMVLVVMVLNS